jgi:hypothetical protein
MKTISRLAVFLLSWPLTSTADPIHPIAGGAYWHHDSNWVFPARVGEFQRVGIPQDIAGSRNASAWYALERDGARFVAEVEIRARDEAAGEGDAPPESRRILHVLDSGEWRVTLYLEGTQPLPQNLLDDFVRGQRWDSLTQPAAH